jgi:hypothetical protein
MSETTEIIEQTQAPSQEPEKQEKEIKWSYSRLHTYGDCHFHYKLKYVDKNYPKFGNIATEFGTAIHHAEEKIANFIKDGQPIDYIDIKNRFIIDCAKVSYKYRDEWYSPNKDSGKTYEEQKYLYLKQYVYDLEKFMAAHPSYIIKGAEVPIDYYYGKYRFTGSIDRLIYDTATDTYLIQDIKSWPIMENKHEDDCKLPIQLGVYSLALSEMYKCDLDKIRCQYDLPLVAQRFFDAGPAGYLDKSKTQLDKWFKGIEEENWKPSPSALCAYWPFSVTNPEAEAKLRTLCPYHSIWDRVTRNKNVMYVPANKWQGIDQHQTIMEDYLKGSE